MQIHPIVPNLSNAKKKIWKILFTKKINFQNKISRMHIEQTTCVPLFIYTQMKSLFKKVIFSHSVAVTITFTEHKTLYSTLIFIYIYTLKFNSLWNLKIFKNRFNNIKIINENLFKITYQLKYLLLKKRTVFFYIIRLIFYVTDM